MKIKIRRKHKHYQIVVDDKVMNKMYEHSQSEPIILASLSQAHNTGFWQLKDLRLTNGACGFSGIEASTQQFHSCSNKKEHDFLVNQIKYYISKKEGKEFKVVWDSFDGVVFPGDKIDKIHTNGLVPETGEYCWSYTEARKHFDNIALFWQNYNEHSKDGYLSNEAIAINNPHAQITNMMFWALLDKEKQREKENAVVVKKKKM